MIPAMRVGLIAPEPLMTDRAFLRIHNRAAKDALRDQALEHHKKRLPGHFKATGRGKYGYKERKPGYKARKYREGYGRTDLVRTGATRDKMTGEDPKIRMGGKAANPDGSTGQLKLTMRLSFPFGLDAQHSHEQRADAERKFGRQFPMRENTGVTIADMRKEIGKIIATEARQIADGFHLGYVKNINAELKSRPRIRKKLGL